MTNSEKKELLEERDRMVYRVAEINAKVYLVENDWLLWALNNDSYVKRAYDKGVRDERRRQRLLDV